MFFVSFKCNAQEINSFIENRLRQIEESDISNQDKELLVEQLYNLYTNPINLNDADENQLQILGLDDFQIFSLQHYIKETGELLSIYELKYINGFDGTTINNISPFVHVSQTKYKPPLRLDSVFKHSSHEIRLQYKQVLEKSRGYTRTDNKGYLGKGFATTFRYYMDYFDRMHFSIVGDKDAGEPFFNSMQKKGFDYYAIQLTLKDIGFIEQVTLGDYRLNFGEGLAIGQGFSLNYLTTDANIKKRNFGIQPHRSTTEYGYNRGIATNIKIGKSNLFLFASYDKVDYSGSILTEGLHRTASELEKKDSNANRMGGVHWTYQNKGLQIGATALYYDYKYPIKHSNATYQKYYFEGKHNNVLATDFSYLYKRLRLFGEIAVSRNKAFAYIAGLQINLAYKTTLSLAYRDYGSKFQNFYSGAIGAQSRNMNEKGVNINFAHRINDHLSYYAGTDFFHFPFNTYRSSSPANGFKIRSEIRYTPNDNNMLRLTYKLNNRQEDEKISDTQKILTDNTVQQLQFSYIYSINEYFQLQSRLGYSFSSTYQSNQNNGYFAYLETIYKGKRIPLQLNLRYAYFNTTDYDNHFSIYEYNLPLNYSSAILNGNGHRLYLFIKTKPWKNMELSARYAVYIYKDRDEISSGNDLIASSRKQDIGIQLFVRF